MARRPSVNCTTLLLLHEPAGFLSPVVVLGIGPEAASEDSYKDTERNIRDSGEFVVNLVDGVSILSIRGGRA